VGDHDDVLAGLAAELVTHQHRRLDVVGLLIGITVLRRLVVGVDDLHLGRRLVAAAQRTRVAQLPAASTYWPSRTPSRACSAANT